jgi:intracellular septation protein A
MKLWTYRFRPVIDGTNIPVALETGFTWSRLVIRTPDGPRADRQDFQAEPYRLHRVELPLANGPTVFEAGPRNAWAFGLRVSRCGAVLWESHRNPHAYLGRIREMLVNRQGDRSAIDPGVFRRNAPAIAADVALGLLFFVTGKLTDLRTAALVAAGAGLALFPLQWTLRRVLRKPIDLLGGMALFGVVMLLLAAGFAWYFDSDFAVQLKATALGGVSAAAFTLDALCGGKHLARRVAAYLPYRDLNLRRLGLGLALTGTAMAGANLLVALAFSKDVWLFYTTWADFVVAALMGQWALTWARKGG